MATWTVDSVATELSKHGYPKTKIDGNDVIILTDVTSRKDRKEILVGLHESAFKDAVYVPDKGAGSIRIKIGNKSIKILMKPVKTAGGVILKPGIFPGMTDIDIPLSTYGEKLLKSIELAKLDEDQKKLLSSIAQYHISFSQPDLNAMKNTFKMFGSCIPLNTINNDFSELLGPLAIAKKQLLGKKIASTAKIFVAFKGNYPLLDYIIKNGRSQYNISAKSGDTTNTLKPGDLVSLIETHKKSKTLMATDQYKVLKILADNSVKLGPILAVQYLKTKRYDDASFITDSAEYSEELRQNCENVLVQISKTVLDFTPIFKEATNAKVYYVKFKMTNDASPTWEYIDTTKTELPDESVKRIILRSKNYVGRPSDKLGLQPK